MGISPLIFSNSIFFRILALLWPDEVPPAGESGEPGGKTELRLQCLLDGSELPDFGAFGRTNLSAPSSALQFGIKNPHGE